MLQSIVSLHERVSKAKILTPKPLPIMKLSATRLESTGYFKLLHILMLCSIELLVHYHTTYLLGVADKLSLQEEGGRWSKKNKKSCQRSL